MMLYFSTLSGSGLAADFLFRLLWFVDYVINRACEGGVVVVVA